MSGATRLDRLAREHRDWAPYVAVLREAAAALGPGDGGHDGRALVESIVCTRGRPGDDAPLLQGASIAADGRALEAWMRRLLRVAAEHGAGVALGDAARARTLDAVTLAQAAIDHDTARVAGVAAAAGADPDALLAVAHLAITPVLDACRRAHETALPPYWPHGSCPVCGAWATLSEARGLDRSLRLRCARCAADWRTEWLRCSICGNRDHETLGSLVPDGVGETRRVETCEPCRGYVKTLTTLIAIPASEIALEDLATVDLDLIALEHGYRKPAPAAPLGARLVVTERARVFGLGALSRRA